MMYIQDMMVKCFKDKRVIINSISFDNIKLDFSQTGRFPNIRTLIPRARVQQVLMQANLVGTEELL